MAAKMIITILQGASAGVVATVTMDVLGIVAQRTGLVAGAKGEWVGRWYLGVMRGKFYHPNIADTLEARGEKMVALIGHYVIGIVLAVFYLFAADWAGFAPDSFLVAFGYGIATCVFPWLLVYPGLGFGVFGFKAPPGLRLFSASLVNHSFYGFGLWWILKLLQPG